jgi:anthranilate synthase component II
MNLRIAVIDNYDSFTYNLVHYLEKIVEPAVTVFRNDEVTVEQLKAFDAIVISPGPGLPSESGITLQVIDQLHASKPILGVCLGHQAIGEYFGGTLLNLPQVFHGIATPIQIDSEKDVAGIFNNLPNSIEVGRYHSWVVANENFPSCLHITAVDEWGNCMALQHQQYRIIGVQFHPESILTPQGETILKNWILSIQ